MPDRPPVVIPETITVHLGPPDAPAENITIFMRRSPTHSTAFLPNGTAHRVMISISPTRPGTINPLLPGGIFSKTFPPL